MSATEDTTYYKLGNYLAIFCVVVYGLLRVITLAHEGEARIAAVSAVFYGACALVLWVLHRIKPLPSAFTVPFAMFLLYTVGTVVTKSFTHYFPVCLAITGVGAVYGNKKTLFRYMLITNALIGALFIFRLPLVDFSRAIPLEEALFNWLAMIVSSVFFWTIAAFASDKNSKSIRAMDSFTTMMDTTTNWVALVDELNRVDYISKPLARFAHIEDRELAAGRPILDLFADMDAKLMIGDLLELHGFNVDLREININGAPHYFRIITDILAGNSKGLFIHISDISDIVLARNDADAARLAAESANKAKSEFLATMSHEIRTPMNAILGMSDLMRVDNLDKVQLTFFEDIKKMSKALLEIINDILDFSKIEAGKLELVPVHFNIVSLFDNIASLCGFLAAGKSLEFRSGCAPDLPKVLYGDEIRIRQILTNVVNNAIKYTRAGYVNFTLKLGTREEREYLVATVEDTGIGIRDEDKAKLFGSFEQLDTRKNRNITGTGLGLAITKRLLDMMGGIVELESEYGKGSCFTIYIPLVAGDPAQVEHADTGNFVKAAPGADIAVLVVDDMPVNLTVALGFLARHDIRADTAAGGEEAVRKVREKLYDLVFMDHMMPGVDGIEAARRIRAWEDEQRKRGRLVFPEGVPIVALSANAVSGARELFIESGMNDFISKPIEASSLNIILSKWLPKEKLSSNEAPQALFTPAFDKKMAVHAGSIGAAPPLLSELNAIHGLNTEAGISHTGGNLEGYYLVLRQFISGFDEGMRTIAEDVEKEDWKDYAIRLHAYKGVMAIIGRKDIAEWAFRLEMAGKSAGPSGAPMAGASPVLTAALASALIKGATAPVCGKLRAFRDALLATSLIHEEGADAKTKITASELTEKLQALESACAGFKATEANAIVAFLEKVSVDDKATAIALAAICRLAASLDYDEAVKKIAVLRGSTSSPTATSSPTGKDI
jgi:signal transduction histidine kinase/CheY-like chemotaxis protein